MHFCTDGECDHIYNYTTNACIVSETGMNQVGTFAKYIYKPTSKGEY